VKILIVDTCYPAFLAAHYASSRGLADRPYAEQWRSLMDTFFGTADSYSFHLQALGHEAHEVVANCRPLQDAWAREHDFVPRRSVASRRRRRREASIVLAQAEDFAPDVVYLQNVAYLDRPTLARLRGRGALVAGQIASEAPSTRQLGAFDLLLTSFPHYVERFRRLGVAAEYFRIGFDERVLERIRDAPLGRHDTVFVGALNRTQHRGGNAVLAEAAESLPIDVWGYRADTWPRDSPIRRRYHGEAWGLDMFRVLRGARIALNRHIEVAENSANNMRLYEATGVGSLLLTDAKPNLSELFTPGEEVVTYADAAELVAKARYYLEHEDERSEIAAAGQARTLREHTYATRMQELVEVLQRAIR
jgi:spore maturation protein CgeB